MESSNPAPLSGTPGDEDIYTRNNNDDVSNRDASSIYKGGIPTSGPPVNKSHKSSPRPRNISNPLQTGILNYLKSQQHDQYNHCLPTYFHPIFPQSPSIPLPKRFTVYTPLLLLPSNTFSLPPEWATLYNTFSSAQRQELYAYIVASFAPMGVTHIAISAPISPTTATGIDNRIRSPTGLAPLYGDFGEASDHVGGEAGRGESALWVRAVQNRGIVQIWAPFHSMFSRGNVVEKARILGIESPFEGLDDGFDDSGKRLLGQRTGDIAVVDMYAGIGYFVFSYLKRGVGRVLGWEINGWSIEGLCRGCKENGWGVKVVKVDKKTGEIEGGIDGLAMGLREEDRVVIFHGDNKFATDVIRALEEAMQRTKTWKRIRHVNLGLLPSSKPSWEGAVKVLDTEAGGWIHVHENVDIKSIGMMEEGIAKEISSLLSSSRGSAQLAPSSQPFIPAAKCIHVERIKTYAPGVMHCVFDIYIPPSPSWLESSNNILV
ncbi:tRNA wybutosine-synthesizing protein [Histoplasma capsulatum var. duboisii H88]|uniref:tRNA wybutosine-synthesizing protein 2 n=2 Tax=Ajellomyces capsulatus (strain H88) TaxID=544711 RepID=F0UMT0_AJEC8|nr:tRNA wybutosine-synthesizing protein [Histoplasma capsulatum var. duboisii H88]